MNTSVKHAQRESNHLEAVGQRRRISLGARHAEIRAVVHHGTDTANTAVTTHLADSPVDSTLPGTSASSW